MFTQYQRNQTNATINLSKEELKKIEFYLLKETDPKGRFTDPLVVSILEKIGNLDDLCECGGQTN